VQHTAGAGGRGYIAGLASRDVTVEISNRSSSEKAKAARATQPVHVLRSAWVRSKTWTSTLFSRRDWLKRTSFHLGHRACQGCAEALAVRLVMKALGRNTIVAMATGCMEIISSRCPRRLGGPWIHVAFENASAVISGCDPA